MTLPVREDGFTLIEVLVVVFIVAVLAFIALPQYTRTVEHSKAEDALTTLHLMAAAHRMYSIDHGSTYLGADGETNPISDSCTLDTAKCSDPSVTGACKLLACGYLSPQNWEGKAYEFYVIPNVKDAVGGIYCKSDLDNALACAKRKTGSSPGTDADPYKDWGYVIDIRTKATALPTAKTYPDAAPPP